MTKKFLKAKFDCIYYIIDLKPLRMVFYGTMLILVEYEQMEPLDYLSFIKNHQLYHITHS